MSRRGLLAGAGMAAMVAGPVQAQQQPGPGPYGDIGTGPMVSVGGRLIPKGTVFRVMPVTLPLASIRITSLYGMRPNPFGGYGTEFHPGVDFGGPVGTPVYSTAAGVVEIVETRGWYGLMVSVRHGMGFSTRYGHLSRTNVVPGQLVDRNTVLGEIGNTGRSTGPHLYFEIWHSGSQIDPVRFILGMHELYHHLG